MAPADELQEGDELQDEGAGVAVEDGVDGGEPESLSLDIKITKPSACERHVIATISREDIERYFDNAFSEMMPSAAVPGFRAGRAPRKLVEQKFKAEIADQVKGSLLMDSLAQISEESDFAAISEPDLNLDAVEIPDEGPMTFEFDIEVRPEFEMPKWKGLKITRPVREFTKEDVDAQIEQMLSRYGQLAPHDGAAEKDDYITATITTKHDGKQIAREEEEVVRLRDKLSFIDGSIDGFAKLMDGVKAGSKKSAKLTIGDDAPNEDMRGKEVEVEFEVLEVKRLKMPELTEDFLKELGDFKTEGDLRDAIQQNLERQLEYRQQQNSRQQITSMLTESANWELPPGLLKRQSVRELERAVMELRRSGFSEGEIRARENELRQNSGASTATALKEHFILERIAEEQEIDIEEGDYEKEIFLMSMQSGESPRRVRAQLEKRGLMDVLRNQIVERKVLEVVQAEAKFNDEPFEPDENNTEALPIAASGAEDVIPDAADEKKSDDKPASDE